MDILTSKRPIALVAIVLLFTVSVTSLKAQKLTKVSGKITVAAEVHEQMSIGDVDDHTVTFSVFEGTNASTGSNKFMDGAHAVNAAYSDLVQYNGPHQTYITLSKKDDAAIAKCQGKNAVIMSPDGEPIVTFEGTFSWIAGTGRFKGIQGNGTYKGQYISPKIYTVEWEGEYFIKK